MIELFQTGARVSLYTSSDIGHAYSSTHRMRLSPGTLRDPNKYWRNLNLAIGNCAYNFLLRHLHGGVSTRGHHIYKSTSTPLLGKVLECKIESGNLQDRYAVQRRKTVVGHGKISVAFSSFLQRAGRIHCTFIGVRCFPIHVCPVLRRVVIVFASRTSFRRLRRLTFDATLDFSICTFSRSS